MKRYLLGLIAIVFAISLSAFSTQKTFSIVFYKKAGAALRSTNPSDYEYHANQSLCSQSTGEICRAEFTDATAPADGASPSGNFVQVIEDDGEYTP